MRFAMTLEENKAIAGAGAGAGAAAPCLGMSYALPEQGRWSQSFNSH